MASGSKCGACQHITKLWFGGSQQAFLCEIYDYKMGGDDPMARYCKYFKRKPYNRRKSEKADRFYKEFI